MISALIKIIFYLIALAIVFLGLNWILLGMTPMECIDRFQNQIGNLTGRTESLPEQMEDTTQDMIQTADRQIQETAENINESIVRQADNLSGEI